MKEVQVNVPGHSYTIKLGSGVIKAVSYTHLRAHET